MSMQVLRRLGASLNYSTSYINNINIFARGLQTPHYKNNASDPDAPEFDMENPFLKERKQCILCKQGIVPDYKNVKLLSQFQSPYTGRIYGKHITGLCKAKQEKVEAEIVKAQNAGLMGYYQKEPCFWKDPKLFDPDNPIRQHRF